MARGTPLAAVLALLISAVWPSTAEACSCVGTKPVCEAFWQTSAVFAGEVLDIRELEQPSDPSAYRHLGSRIVRFRVERAFRGRVGTTIEIQTGSGGGDCGYPFERGGKYLVFANELQGRLTASICGRTRELREATDDVAYVSQNFLPSVGGRVFGEVKAQLDQQNTPVAGYTVSLRGPGREWTAVTDAAGRYEIRDVPAGKFKIAVKVHEGEDAHGERDLHLADTRGCASADFYVVPNGRVVVAVKTSADALPKGLKLQLIEADARQDRPREYYPFRGPEVPKNGEMTWDRLPPGRYLLGINLLDGPTPNHPYPTTFYPGVNDRAAALVIQVGLGERVALDPFTVPAPLAVRAIRGSVVRPDSRVVANANIVLLTPEGRYAGSSVTTDREGRFTLQAIEGVRYRVRGMSGQVRAESEPFELTPATAPLLLVLR